MLKAIVTSRKTGNEKFLNGNTTTLLNYWAWAHSDIMGNAERGKIAEYIVAMTLNVHTNTRTEWDSFDLQTTEGIKVEVKSSAYLQTWVQKTYSPLIFGIQPTQAWNKDDNTYEQTKKRQSDVYVFCIFKSKDQDSANPLDLNQWDFYVLSTKKLNDRVQNQKTITLAGIQKLGAKNTDYSELFQTIQSEYAVE